MRLRRLVGLGLGVASLCLLALPAHAAEPRPGLVACRLQGVEHDVWCGSVRRALDPAKPTGRQIDVHFALLPALARNRKPDAVFFFAGGPGQSAIDLAGQIGRSLARLSNRRDIVLIDQRGSGRSAALRCAEQSPLQPLSESIDAARAVQRLQACRAEIEKLPHGDLRHYTTWVAAQDADAVRRALGVDQIDLVGASYGTRAALEVLRQFPQIVRRVVLDGAAPPDMVLPVASAIDNQAALDAVFSACEVAAACSTLHPALRAQWQALLTALPRVASVAHPVSGRVERITLTREAVLSLVRVPLYVPALAAALPQVISDAANGRFEPLLGLAAALSGSQVGQIAEGMHFAVVCSEDMPRLARPAEGAALAGRVANDFGDSFAEQYEAVCAGWTRGAVPPAFYGMPVATAPVLVLSGGADPATPPRHGEHVVRALGAKSRHVVVPEAGHGVMGIACMRDVVFRFIDAASDDAALKVDADCAQKLPRPLSFVPLASASGR